jgi:tripartite-type tricarboxylate transporter receptor subunit TctC
VSDPRFEALAAVKLPRRKFLHLAMGATTLAALSDTALALDYPTRPVRIIDGFPPGGASDLVARLSAQWLSRRLHQQFIVENRPGASSNIAAEEVVQAPADGYTLLLITATNAINATLYDHLSFNFIRDIAPVAGIVRVPNVMVINPSVPADTVPAFIAYAKANPGKINMASGGVGTPVHVAGELFKAMAGVNLVHVPYHGDAPALVDLVGGQVQVMFDLLSASIAFIRSGKLRALAVTTAARSEALPNVPTVSAKSGHGAMRRKTSLFDHLVGASRQRRRYFDPQCFGSLEVDGELEVGGQQERKITRFLAL